MDNVFEKLTAINVADHIEQKNGLNYLSWSYAWDYIKRAYPDASYTIWKDANNLPYVYDALTGYMVYTSVTIEGITHEMWLPVMDGANKAMKAIAYEYEANEWQNGQKHKVLKTVQPATMTDINKAVMRCLVKNLAMFGLGLSIYTGEDLPTDEDENKPKEELKKAKPNKNTKAKEKPLNKAQEKPQPTATDKVKSYLSRHTDVDVAKLCKAFKINSLDELTEQLANYYIAKLKENGGDIDG